MEASGNNIGSSTAFTSEVNAKDAATPKVKENPHEQNKISGMTLLERIKHKNEHIMANEINTRIELQKHEDVIESSGKKVTLKSKFKLKRSKTKEMRQAEKKLKKEQKKQ